MFGIVHTEVIQGLAPLKFKLAVTQQSEMLVAKGKRGNHRVVEELEVCTLGLSLPLPSEVCLNLANYPLRSFASQSEWT